MFYQLPPVGDPILCCETGSDAPSTDTLFAPYRVRYYDSGTSALAAAIVAGAASRQLEHPEVILPAYGCPDLVAAAVFAGAKPVLADLQADRPWMALEEVERSITGNTAAVVAVDLFGIPERLDDLRAITEPRGITLIEDSAQSFPVREKGDFWSGDLVVLSFGRGKPVSLLGGGAVLYRSDAQAGLLPAFRDAEAGNTGESLPLRMKALLYNRLIDPRWYWIPQSLPFLHLGETRYHTLEGIRPMDRLRRNLLSANIEAYRRAGVAVQNEVAAVVEEMSSGHSRVTDLTRACDVPAAHKLLRYPLLVDADLRGQLLQRLRRRGLGPSVMYPAILPEIDGLSGMIDLPGSFTAARAFAKRVLTLPTHRQVRQRDITAMRIVFESFVRQQDGP